MVIIWIKLDFVPRKQYFLEGFAYICFIYAVSIDGECLIECASDITIYHIGVNYRQTAVKYLEFMDFGLELQFMIK